MGEELDEPIGYLVLPRGTPVVTSDGVTVGKVHKVSTTRASASSTASLVQSDERAPVRGRARGGAPDPAPGGPAHRQCRVRRPARGRRRARVARR